MPLRCVNFILRVSSVNVSGSVDFTGNKRIILDNNGGAFAAAFAYKIGDPPATANFQATLTPNTGTTVSVSPTAPVTQRQRMGATSPSDTEPVDPNEVQTGRVSGTVPENTGTAKIEYALQLIMVQPG